MKNYTYKDNTFKEVITKIRDVALESIPKNAKVILFGSRARGDFSSNSDWDILLLLDNDKLSQQELTDYSYPFWELGWQINQMIHPIIYTKSEWVNKNNPIFRNNVEKDGILIC
ncbi:MAG: nucleotidyltransferase domain-containing protein [Bacteroidaceae bacterium]|nr:nucleotidyltransferase domain-containing protein [Bacteroidaceae bacterium]